MHQDAPFLFRFSTQALPAPVRFPAFREEFVRKVMKTDIVDHSGDAPRFDLSLRVPGPVRMGTLVGTPCAFVRDSQRTRDGVGDLTLQFVADRTLHVTHNTREFSAPAGSAYFTDYSRPISTQAPRGGRIRNVSVAPDALRPLVRHPEEATGLLRDSAALHLLGHYLAALETLTAPPDPDLARAIGVHLLDLMAAALGPVAAAREMIGARGVRAARLHAVQAALDRHFVEPDFDLDQLTRRLGLSRRYLQNLLQSTGRTFTEHMTERRLRRAFELLRDPGHAQWRIIDIAGAAGFGDLSYFNRMFRSQFGDTPTSVRRGPHEMSASGSA